MELPISLTVNGEPVKRTIPAQRLLLDFLRDDLGLTGAKEACSVGVCGVCTVLIDGAPIASCIMLAAQAHGRSVTTVESLATADGQLHPVQEAFVNNSGFQCGICTPGQIMSAKALLDANPSPTEEEIKDWMLGNLCRCTGYYKIIDSIKDAAEALSHA
jgi:carbon-monoxide dehydrogenase small subunit